MICEKFILARAKNVGQRENVGLARASLFLSERGNGCEKIGALVDSTVRGRAIFNRSKQNLVNVETFRVSPRETFITRFFVYSRRDSFLSCNFLINLNGLATFSIYRPSGRSESERGRKVSSLDYNVDILYVNYVICVQFNN